MKVKLIAMIAALPVVGLIAVGIRYEVRISPDFRAQIQILQAATREQGQEQKDQDAVNLLETELQTAELTVENDRLDIENADLNGKMPSYTKLKADISVADTLKAALGSMTDLPHIEIYPHPDVVVADLPSHAHTIKDHYLIHRLHESSVLDDEATACYSSKPEATVAHPDCDALEKRAQEEGQYVSSAAK